MGFKDRPAVICIGWAVYGLYPVGFMGSVLRGAPLFFILEGVVELLRAVNRILGRLGENPVTSIENKNPTVTVILQAIADESRTAQGRGWWFNTYETKLYPDPDGRIRLPDDTLDWQCKDRPSVVRGKFLVCSETMSEDWSALGVSSLKGVRTFHLEYEELPESFQEWVIARAAMRAVTNDLGMDDVVQLLMQEEHLAREKVMSDHMRHKGYSTAKTPMFRRMTRHIWR